MAQHIRDADYIILCLPNIISIVYPNVLNEVVLSSYIADSFFVFHKNVVQPSMNEAYSHSIKGLSFHPSIILQNVLHGFSRNLVEGTGPDKRADPGNLCNFF